MVGNNWKIKEKEKILQKHLHLVKKYGMLIILIIINIFEIYLIYDHKASF